VSFVCASVARLSIGSRISYDFGLLGFICLALASGGIIATTGGIMSPFIALWMMLAFLPAYSAG